MATLALISLPKSLILHEFSQIHSFAPISIRNTRPNATQRNKTLKSVIVSSSSLHKRIAVASLLGTGFALTTITLPSLASELTLTATSSSSLQLTEPSNALSLPTWAIHVSSVVEWIIAMALVWQYGEKTGYESWKGLSWGMIPLLGGAFCACTWHFFYNSESLEVLVALQAALTVIGNITMCIAAFRIYKYSQEKPDKL